MPGPNDPIRPLPPAATTTTTPAATPATTPVAATLNPAATAAAAGIIRPALTLQPIDVDKLVTVNGQLGVFTPVSTGNANDPNSAANQQVILDSLKTEVAQLRQQNLDLAGKLDLGNRPARSPEDFASAVQGALDQLQAQLSAMSNPVSNFAVKEFRLESNVHVDVNALGQVSYRFFQPGDTADPNTTSRISIDLVPIPKSTTAGSFVPGLFQAGLDVSSIEGLTASALQTLRTNQISTVGDLLSAGTRARTSTALAALLGDDRAKLAGWLSAAELLTIQGMTGAQAAVLLAAGFQHLSDIVTFADGVIAAIPAPTDTNASAPDGNAAAADALAKKFNDALTASHRTDVQPVTSAQAQLWIRAARAYVEGK